MNTTKMLPVRFSFIFFGPRIHLGSGISCIDLNYFYETSEHSLCCLKHKDEEITSLPMWFLHWTANKTMYNYIHSRFASNKRGKQMFSFKDPAAN